MISFQELKSMPEANRLLKLVLFALLVWLLGLVFLLNANGISRQNKERLGETDSIMNAAVMIKSYPKQDTSPGREPLTAVSSIIDSLGLKDRVGQMNSGTSGIVLQVNGIYPDELTNFIEAILRNKLSIKTAEIRAMSSGKEGRLINVTVALEAAAQ